jgi:hypothetical protein
MWFRHMELITGFQKNRGTGPSKGLVVLVEKSFVRQRGLS